MATTQEMISSEIRNKGKSFANLRIASIALVPWRTPSTPNVLGTRDFDTEMVDGVLAALRDWLVCAQASVPQSVLETYHNDKYDIVYGKDMLGIPVIHHKKLFEFLKEEIIRIANRMEFDTVLVPGTNPTTAERIGEEADKVFPYLGSKITSILLDGQHKKQILKRHKDLPMQFSPKTYVPENERMAFFHFGYLPK